MKTTIILFLLSLSYLSCDTYLSGDGEKHLCGAFELDALLSDSLYAEWYLESYNEYQIKQDIRELSDKLKDVKVEIYLGTWCEDSKEWVPKFIKLWDKLNLDRKQLDFIALYDKSIFKKSKKGPNGEEKGKQIFRVPTFIFYKNDIELGRIIESPFEDLVSDFRKIAENKDLQSNYPASTYLINLSENESIENIKLNRDKIVNQLKDLVEDYSELNSIATYFIDLDRMDLAMEVFEINNKIFKNSLELLEDFAVKLEQYSNSKEIVDVYFRILELDKNNSNAQERLNYLTK